MKLLEPIALAGKILKNRMVMAAMTRSRAYINGTVGDMTVEYYKQRSGAGLILSEGINISEDAIGYPFTPCLYTTQHVEALKKVTDAVHENGGLIFAQLWHTGRIGHSVDRIGKLPVAPSTLAIIGKQHFTSQGPKDYEVPRALTADEIKQTIKDYRQAALNAIEGGFDGVELHAANGYLPHQFLSDSANERTDNYGGSIENKSRFILEVMQEFIDAIGGDKVGIKLSPFHPYGDIIFTDPTATFTYLINQLNKLDFAFVELMKKSPMFPPPESYPAGEEIEIFGGLSKNTLIANTAYNKENGEDELNKGIAKLISFGSLFLANPDLPKRFELNAELNEVDPQTFFGGNEQGYIDYPFLDINESIAKF